MFTTIVVYKTHKLIAQKFLTANMP